MKYIQLWTYTDPLRRIMFTIRASEGIHRWEDCREEVQVQ